MADIIAVPQEDASARLRRLALEGISSPSTRRAYSAAMDEFLTWAPYQNPAAFSKALVQQYKSMLLEKLLAPFHHQSEAGRGTQAGLSKPPTIISSIRGLPPPSAA